jgi:hypothetical protein
MWQSGPKWRAEVSVIEVTLGMIVAALVAKEG